jgi:hypothetical protein
MSSGLHVKYSLFLYVCNEPSTFSSFSKNTQMYNFTKIRPVGAELFHADKRTDMTKLTVALHNFAKTPKNVPTEEEHSHFHYKAPRPVDVLASAQVFHGLLSFFLVSVIPQVLHSHISFRHDRRHISY